MEADQDYISSFPFKTEQCPELGRYLVASRDIKKGEVILKDLPLASGPIRGCPEICPGCYETSLEGECDLCGWPICSETCPGLKTHQEQECKLLQSGKEWSLLQDCVMLIRCLILKGNKRKKLLEMETNWEKWLTSPHFPSSTLILPILQNFNLEKFSKKEIFTVQAILDINSYEVRLPHLNIQAIYKLASLAEHSCLPNTHRVITSSLELTLLASEDIPQGEHISTSYCDMLWPTWKRQQFLQESKFFTCSCERCLSPDEASAHLSSLLCKDCGSPAVPQFPSRESDYVCLSCSATIPKRDAYLLERKAEAELSELDKYAEFETISTFETWLKKWTEMEGLLGSSTFDDRNVTSYSISSQLLLHPHHSLVLDCCHTLFLLYPSELQEAQQSDLSNLRRKEALGKHLLTATKPLFKGISKFRGTILHELALTKVSLFFTQLEKEKADLRELAEEISRTFQESHEMLKYEPEDQPEGKLAVNAISYLKQFKDEFAQYFSKDN